MIQTQFMRTYVNFCKKSRIRNPVDTPITKVRMNLDNHEYFSHNKWSNELTKSQNLPHTLVALNGGGWFVYFRLGVTLEKFI